jgi:hypothetical protein
VIAPLDPSVPPPEFVASRRFRYASAGCLGAVILAASVTKPGDSVRWTLFGVNSTVYLHLLAYAGFAGTIGYALGSTERPALFIAIAVSTLYGGGVELLQSAIPYRTMTLWDALINALGATIGATLWGLVAPWFDVTDGKPKERSR